MSEIVPYDIDNQISRMEDVLHYDAAISKLVIDDKQEELSNFSIKAFWKKMMEVNFYLAFKPTRELATLHRHTELLLPAKPNHSSPPLSVAASKKIPPVFSSHTSMPVLTRRANMKKNTATGAATNFYFQPLTSIFSEGVFDFELLSSHNMPAGYTTKDVKTNVLTTCKDALRVANLQQPTLENYSVRLYLNQHISKYVLFRSLNEAPFKKKLEETATNKTSQLILTLNQPGNYLLCCYEPLKYAEAALKNMHASELNLVRDLSVRQYVFLLQPERFQLAELPKPFNL